MRIHTTSTYIKHFFFKSGENHVQLEKSFAGENVELFHSYGGDQTLFKLAMIVDALRRQGAKNISLVMPYFPGARQDRVCNYGEALTVKVYADFINGLKFDRVRIFDPHSDVVTALIDRCEVVKNHEFVRKAIPQHPNNYILVSPDAGANKKIFDLAKILGGPEVVRADKIRDVTNGKIIGTEVYADDLSGKISYIVDDISSYGGTFKALAKELKKKNADKVVLIVSHYEGVADKQSLKDSGIDQVITTNSLPNGCVVGDDFIQLYNIDQLILDNS